MTKIKAGIVGYGNLGKATEMALANNPDFELVAIFTRRETAVNNSKMIHISKVAEYKDRIDIMFMCGGSATDLPVQVPEIAKMFNTVDSFDTHANIPQHFERIQSIAKESGKLCLISTGWDPGLFSLNRVLSEAILPSGKSYTFWGKGVSQGHSDAIRRIEGVLDGKQYTVPVESALKSVRNNENKDFTTREKHTRVCYVVAAEGADKARIEREIKTMPNYFADYDTEVNFISQEELNQNHAGLPHGGTVIRSGKTGNNTAQNIEFSIKLGSNPEFTSSILVCCARAVYRMHQSGQTGAITILDIPIGLMSKHSPQELREKFL